MLQVNRKLVVASLCLKFRSSVWSVWSLASVCQLLCLSPSAVPDVDQEIAEFIAERDGHPARADRIYLTNGASEGKHGALVCIISPLALAHSDAFLCRSHVHFVIPCAASFSGCCMVMG